MEEKARILVVDDLPEKLLVFTSVLEELGQELVTARSGREALREVLAREFAVILLDVNMPDIDGLATAKLIRQYRKSAHTPIIFITAYADELQTAHGYSLGAVDYILSPVQPEVLRSKVKVFVDLYRMRQRAKALAETEAARAAAEDANRRKDEFLAMLSHELRNPLAPIRNAVELMRRIGSTEPRIALARDVIDRQVTQLARLVDELLDVSRISQSKIALKKEPVELARVVGHGVETARPMIDARRQDLAVEVGTQPVWLHGDFARLAQVVANLLNNASKYTPEGGRIRISAAAGEGVATIAIEDNGSGIDPEFLPQIFELFVQGERELDRAQGGLGIGLTLVRRLVELHHGRVEAYSAGPGKGACFKVMLPSISALPATSAPRAPSGGARPVSARRVLVVDDNVDAAESTAAFLRLEGHEVRTAGDGNEALAAARAFAPQVVVLDIGLPGLDGYALARRLRGQPGTSDALLIALTGYGRGDDRQKASAAGFDCFFVKPADPCEIQQAIDQGCRPAATARRSETTVK